MNHLWSNPLRSNLLWFAKVERLERLIFQKSITALGVAPWGSHASREAVDGGVWPPINGGDDATSTSSASSRLTADEVCPPIMD